MMKKYKKRLASLILAAAVLFTSVQNILSPLAAVAEEVQEAGYTVEEENSSEETETETESVTDGENGVENVSENGGGEEESNNKNAENELTEQSFTLYPEGKAGEQIVSLDGLMPQGATPCAVDVSETCEGVAAYDITINNDGEDYQPGEENPIRVEITDPDIPENGNFTLWHITDEGEREEITNFSFENGTVSFFATGFSVYEVVEIPGYVPAVLEQLDGNAFYISNDNGDSTIYFGDQYQYNNNRTYYVITGSESVTNAAQYHFVKTAENKYQIYTIINETANYLRMDYYSNRTAGMTLDPDPSQATEFNVGFYDDDELYIYCNLNWWNYYFYKDGNNFRGYNGQGNASRMKLTPVEENDPAGIDGKTYGLMLTKLSGTVAGLLADNQSGNANRRKAAELEKKANPLDTNKLVYKTKGDAADVTLWTFTNITGKIYYVTTVVNGVTKYLRVTNRSVTLGDDPDDPNCQLTVTPGSGDYAGTVRISYGNYGISLYNSTVSSGFSTGTTGSANEWFSLVEKSVIADDDFVVNVAQKISVCDIQDGQDVIIYTRVWNDTEKKYEFYIVDSEGRLFPAYEIGESIEWYGAKISNLVWNFTAYKDSVTGLPNHYYEFQNTYTGNYLAPQISDGQILSDSTIGVNLEGRRNNEYYSTIIAWDNTYYQYSGLKVEGENIVSAPMSQATDFYFAIFKPDEDKLTTVDTVDNNEYGIKMKMIDYTRTNTSPNNRCSTQYNVLGNTAYTNGNPTKNLLKRWIETGSAYPAVAVNGYTSHSLSELFAEATAANHLFLEKTHNESGYFEYDCTNNFAHYDAVSKNFTVYDQVATMNRDTSGDTGRFFHHGQFMPYNDIDPTKITNISNTTNAAGEPLAADDPRREKPLYGIPYNVNYNNGQDGYANYFFGMELEAGFTQTVSGCDAWGNDMIFEFTGDDDFWLYVDDILVIDLGGIHDAISGSVNFKTGVVKATGSEDTTLRAIFEEVYKARNPKPTWQTTAAYNQQVTAYLDQYFDGAKFKDYSSHTMKLYYMERGEGASNLHLRFNLASVKPGQVRLEKKVTSDSAKLDLDYQLVEYPFQIYYQVPLEDETKVWKLLEPAGSGDDNIGVYYPNSTRAVKFAETYTPINGTEYKNVYFLNANDSVYISFPDETIVYKIVECGVTSPEIYDKVYCNGSLMTGSSPDGDRTDNIQSTGTDTSHLDFECESKSVSDRPLVAFENHVNPDSIRTMTFTKQLYDEQGNAIYNDPTTFDFRLYLDRESADMNSLSYASMHKYHVKSPDGNYCIWDAGQGKFVAKSITSTAGLTDAALEDITFFTSPNGSISKIPAWYTVEVIDLPVGTKFKVVEKDYELPLGYGIKEYDRNGGSYYVNEGDPENTGIVRSSENPSLFVKNVRGYGLVAKKIWADSATVAEHQPVYMAVYKKNGANETYVEDTLKQLCHPYTSLKWFLSDADGGFENYVVREVTGIEANSVDSNDNRVLRYTGTMRAVQDNDTDTLTVGERAVGSDSFTDRDYYVNYTMGAVTGSVDGLANVRTDTVKNTPDSKSIALKLSEWNGTAIDRDFKEAIEGGKFTLTLTKPDGTVVDYGQFTSDGSGIIADLYDYQTGQDNIYTLTQTESPEGWYGNSEPVRFYIENVNGEERIVLINPEDDGWVNHKDRNDPRTLGDIIVYNRQVLFNVIKYEKGKNNTLANAEFALYKGIKQSNGSYLKDYYPISGYNSLITAGDGIVPQIDSSLAAGRYYLQEKRAPEGFDLLESDIVFDVTKLGKIVLVSAPNGTLLITDEISQDGKTLFTIKAINSRSADDYVRLTLTKTVTGNFGNKKKDFTFTLTVEGAAEDAVYEWAKNGVNQPSLSSGGEFTMSHGDTIIIDLPRGSVVTVKENNEVYSTTFKLNSGPQESGNCKSFTMNDDSTLAVTNSLSVLVATGIMSRLGGKLILTLLPVIFVAAAWFVRRKYFKPFI